MKAKDITFCEMFQCQMDLQTRMGWPCGDGMAGFKENVLAAQVELVEALNETPWKPWKPSKFDYGIEIDKHVVATELTDVLQFVVNAAMALGITADDMVYALRGKWIKNYQRIQDNQVTTTGE